MVEFIIKIHPRQHLAYIPKELYAVLGPKTKAIGNRAAVLFFAENLSMDDVLRSLEIIKADLQHAQELEQKETQKHVCIDIPLKCAIHDPDQPSRDTSSMKDSFYQKIKINRKPVDPLFCLLSTLLLHTTTYYLSSILLFFYFWRYSLQCLIL